MEIALRQLGVARRRITVAAASGREKSHRFTATDRQVAKLSRQDFFTAVAPDPCFVDRARASTAQTRVETVLHELFHLSRRFDGTLHSGRRHAVLGKAFARKLGPLVRRYLKLCPPELLTELAHTGEVRVLQWLERPGSAYIPGTNRRVRRVYTEDQLYYGIARMVTRKARASRGHKSRDS